MSDRKEVAAHFEGCFDRGRSSVPKVLVMMATYNGAEYLTEQIDSILRQRGVWVTLWVRDDLSQDSTLSILFDYAAKFPTTVMVRQNTKRLGVGMNFMQMVYEARRAEFDYYAFSDQDDVWLPDKLKVAISEIKRKESDLTSKSIEGIGIPILYCSDLIDVDANLENPSRELGKLPSVGVRRGSPLVRNIYSGCTMVFNNAHLVLSQKFELSRFYRIHDAWMVLLAFYCGNLTVDSDKATLLRRITGNNLEGVTAPRTDLRKASVQNVLNEPNRSASRAAQQLLAYSGYMSDEDRSLVESFANYADSLGGRLRWAFSGRYRSLSLLDTFLVRIKFLLGRI